MKNLITDGGGILQVQQVECQSYKNHKQISKQEHFYDCEAFLHTLEEHQIITLILEQTFLLNILASRLLRFHRASSAKVDAPTINQRRKYQGLIFRKKSWKKYYYYNFHQIKPFIFSGFGIFYQNLKENGHQLGLDSKLFLRLQSNILREIWMIRQAKQQGNSAQVQDPVKKKDYKYGELSEAYKSVTKKINLVSP